MDNPQNALVRFVESQKKFPFLLVIAGITILRNGLGVFGASWENIRNDRIDLYHLRFPQDYRSSPILVLVRGIVAGNPLPWYLLTSTLTILILLFCVRLYFELYVFDELVAKYFLILISISPMVSILLKSVGNYDSFLYFAVILGIYSRTRTRAILMGALFGACNAEAALIGGLSTLFATKIMNIEHKLWRNNAQAFLKSTWLSGAIILVMAAPFGFSERGEITSRWIPVSLSTFIYSFPQTVYAILGGLWPLFILLLLRLSALYGLRHLAFVVAPFFLALACQAITSDGTRVAISVFLPFTLIMINYWILSPKKFDYEVFSIFMGIVMPAIIVQNIWIMPSLRQLVLFLKLPLGL